MRFKLAELFCGPGGIALGAKLAGKIHTKNQTFIIEPYWASDYDEDTCRTYALNIHGKRLEDTPNVVCKDVRQLDIESVDACEALAFGFPCNDFSIVGETKGLNGSFGPLYSYGIKYLRAHQPLWFIAENVGGLSHANEGSALEIIMDSMCDAGYNITPHLYKFEEFGVPQARHRLIIVGIRKDQDVNFLVPSPTHNKNEFVNAKDALTVPEIPNWAENQERTRQSKNVIRRLEYIKPGENAWTANIPHELQLNVKGATLSNIYKRLDPGKPAYTVTGSGGGGTHMYHWEEPRALTNRERARLQTFPDDFHFQGSKESVRKQIGMAVPPQGIAIIFQAILKSYAMKNYPHVEANIRFEKTNRVAA